MRRFSAVLILLTFAFSAHSWTAFSYNPKNYTGEGCYSEEYGEMAFGEDLQPPNECILLSCQKGGISYVGCSSVNIADEVCKVMPGNLSKPYPDCCYEIKCHDEL